jgi:methyl-accepting chemotaxis protein
MLDSLLRSLTFRSKILAGYGAVLSLMVVVTLVLFFSIKSLVTEFSWVDHTHNVLDTAAQIEAATVDMETGMRDSLLAGQEQFLEPYTGGNARFYKLIKELSQKVSDNPSQVAIRVNGKY